MRAEKTAQEERLRETAALLPAEETLNRLIRYETHTDRALHRAIDSLAKLRGATYESLSSQLLERIADGTVVALEQQRTRGMARGLAGKKLPNEVRGGSA